MRPQPDAVSKEDVVNKNEAKKSVEIFGIDAKFFILSIGVSAIALVVGLFLSLSWEQRLEMESLRDEVSSLEDRVTKLQESADQARELTRSINDIAAELFFLKCDLQGGVSDHVTFTCSMGRVTRHFSPPARETPGPKE